MNKKEWIEYFKTVNDREPSERELKIADQSDYEIDADPKTIKDTKMKTDKEMAAIRKEQMEQATEKSINFWTKWKKVFIVMGVAVAALTLFLNITGNSDKSDDYMKSSNVKKTIADILSENYDSDEYDDFEVNSITLKKDKEKDSDKNTTYSGTADVSYQYNDGGTGFFSDPDWEDGSDTVNIRITDTKDDNSDYDNFTVEVLD